MKTIFAAEVAASRLPAGPERSAIVTEQEIAHLPHAVQRWLRWTGAVGAPRVWSFRLHCHGRFKPAIDAEWNSAESWQYNSALDVARIHHLKVQFYGVPVVGRDLYLHGSGHVTIRPLDVVTIERDVGPEFDRSELVTWLDDAVLFAPSMLLGTRTEWLGFDEDEFEVAFHDAGRTVSARVTLDSHGSPLGMDTDSRSPRDPKSKSVRRARWSTPIQGWQAVDGRRIPTRARAVWHLPTGDFAYAELEVQPHDIAFNVAPGVMP